MMREFAIPKEARKHCESLICEGLIDERLLPLKRFGRATGGQLVFLVQLRINDFRVEFLPSVIAMSTFCFSHFLAVQA
jgi:hypothetical protein